ncbi:LysR family transcriptional regulator [Cupriavidus basilensis]
MNQSPWTSMDLRQLRYFVAVAEELHFGRAAERLAITQPPLSFNIRQLEDSLGFALLRRSTREVALTPAGRVMYQEAVKILALARDAQGLASRGRQGGNRRGARRLCRLGHADEAGRGDSCVCARAAGGGGGGARAEQL